MRRWADGLAAIMAGAAILASVSSAGAAPRRVVSLNPCLDAILLEVADPAQITALSRYSRDPRLSAVANVARRFPSTGGSAEEVVALKPDLVLTSGMGALDFGWSTLVMEMIDPDPRAAGSYLPRCTVRQSGHM